MNISQYSSGKKLKTILISLKNPKQNQLTKQKTTCKIKNKN